MMIHSMIEIIYILIASNVCALALAAYFWRQSRKTKDRPESIELQEFLIDLLSSGGLIHVKRIAPTDVVMRARRK